MAKQELTNLIDHTLYHHWLTFNSLGNVSHCSCEWLAPWDDSVAAGRRHLAEVIASAVETGNIDG